MLFRSGYVGSSDRGSIKRVRGALYRRPLQRLAKRLLPLVFIKAPGKRKMRQSHICRAMELCCWMHLDETNIK